MQLVRTQGGWVDEGLDVNQQEWANLVDDPRAVAVFTGSGELLIINDAMQTLLGWPVEELVRRGWMECLYGERRDVEMTLKNLELLSGSTRPPRRHSRIAQRGDGRFIVLDLLSFGFDLADGQPALFTIAADATQRATPLSARGFREMVEDAPDILVRIDAKTGHYLFVSRAVESLMGYTPEDLYANPELRRSELLPAYRETYERAVRAVVRGTPQWCVLEYQRRDGGVVTLHQALYPIFDAQGQVMVVEGVARDITAVRELERRLQKTIEELRARNEELSSLDRLKSQLLANVSHELRTPLVTIKGYNELILRGSLGEVSPRQRRALEIAAGSTERLVELIESLLDFARLEEGRVTLNRTRVDLRQVIRDVVAQHSARIADKGLTLRLDLGPSALEVDGDRVRLEQIVRSLLSNAEKFSDGPGDIEVRVVGEGERTVLTVSDTGIGIPRAEREKVFSRFYQVDASTTRRFGGTGIGLALAREIVLLHGGTIELDSAEGRGSTFTVRLPSALPAEPVAEALQPVLLVAAPLELCGSLRARLEADGLMVLTATGADIVRRARRNRPDAVVLALGDDLFETIAALRKDEETASIPVVAMVDDEQRTEALPLVNEVVGPQDVDQAANAVRRLLGHGSRARRRVLIIDDEPEIVEYTRFVLEREGFDVTVATTGEAALYESARSPRDLDLVILDIALAGVDGIEICRTLKAQESTAHLPVLMLTAMNSDDARRGALAAGANGFLVKPFGVDEFLTQVRRHLRQGEATPPAGPPHLPQEIGHEGR